ncbi:MAG: winged helix-turn-helix transcriptional regulator [Clostridia bacterium]|nr:winged helix-turn-helix transcriptional regulator [Clostridia bacterium]
MELTEIFKVLSDDNRLKIVRLISNNKMCASEILEHMKISQPTLSHHMRILTKAGMVKTDKTGTQVYYELNKSKVRNLCAFVREISCHNNKCHEGE